MTPTEGQTTTEAKGDPVAALRDCSFYASPSGFGPNPRLSKYRIIIDRPQSAAIPGPGPACGYPFHVEHSEMPESDIGAQSRCMRPGCRHRWPDQPTGAKTP